MLLENQKMANNIQFEKWTADQVAEWLRGLDVDDAMIPYMHFFLNSGIDGRKLMLMTHADLEKLNVVKLGHQELILEAIDLLRNLRYGYETENLQSLALQLGCKARSLNGEIRARFGENDRNRANTSHGGEARPKRLSILILSTVADLIATLKGLVSWMDKAPFSGFHDLCLVRNTIVKLGLDLINFCQRESTLPDVEQAISISSSALSDICEKLVIGSPDSQLDPLYVQPASLEMATIRKKQGEELGMHILSSYYGVHVISGIKDMSPADLCGKIEKGDEVIQVNHQTVVGWQLKKLVNTLKEKPKEVVLLLKKRPRHISPYGAMPNKKKQNLMTKHAVQSSTLPKSLKKLRSRDGEPKQLRPSLQEFVNSVPSIGDELSSPKEEINDGNDTDNDVFRSGSESPQFTLPVQTDPKQRRATVSGGSPTHTRPLLVIEDIDAPSRPKSFTVTGTLPGVHHEIIINSPSGENLTDLHRLATAMEKRQEYKTKSTPPSLEFSVRKPTPKIIEPKDCISSPVEEDADVTPREEDVVFVGVTYPDRMVHAPERLLDSSTDSVPPSESSIESSQTCTSSLESSSHSPPLEESSLSSEKENTDLVSEVAVTPLHQPPPLIQVTEIRSGAIYPRAPPIHMEVAHDYDKNAPQLTKIRKLDSFSTREGERKERHVVFGGVDSDKDTDSVHEEPQSYICKVVGGVVQKIPVTSGSQENSPAVRRRPKGIGRTLLNRRVSCRDLGKGDCEGFLFKRRLHGRGPLSSHWDKRWCVIKRYYLYCYHHKESEKAEIVIHLPAFQVSPVDHSELKTKKYAFKVHNSGTFFTFASDRQEDMSKWMNKMGLAAIAYANERPKVVHDVAEVATDLGDKDFSESEDEEPTIAPSQDPSHHQPHGTEQLKGAGLMAPAPELRGSQVDLSVMLRRQSERGHNLYGEDKNVTRRSVLSREVLDQIQPELNKLKKLQSLERTLKAKETELAGIEEVLTSSSPAKLRIVRDRFGGSTHRLNFNETDSD